MADISFDEEQQYAQTSSQESEGLFGLVVKLGLANDRQQASYILLGVAIIALIAAGFFFFSSGGSAPKPLVPNIDGTYPTRP